MVDCTENYVLAWEKHVFVEILEFSIKLVKRVATENSIIAKVKVTDRMHQTLT